MAPKFLVGRSTDILHLEAGAGVGFERDGSTLRIVASPVPEPWLGYPAVDGYVLSSTVVGVRSWIPPFGGADGMPGRDGEDGADGYPIPGRRGATGLTGIQGLRGFRGVPGDYGFDGEDGWPIPGRRGVTGATGGTGATGARGPRGYPIPGNDGADGEDLWSVPPPRASNSNPKQFRSMASRNSQQTLTYATLTTIDFDGVQDYDVGGVHSIASDPDKFYVPVGGAGTWLCFTSIRVEVPAGKAMTQWQLRIYQHTGGGEVLIYYTDQSDFGTPVAGWIASTFPLFHGNVLAAAEDGDYFYVQMYTISSDASDLKTWTNVTFFQCVKLN